MRKVWLATFAFVVIATLANAQAYTVLYNFGSNPGDPVFPEMDAIAQGRDGNMYSSAHGGTTGRGVVFRITPTGTLTPLHTFNATDGAGPAGGLSLATDGHFYGTTEYGGVNGINSPGTVFKITPDGSLSTLHFFSGGTDGANPTADPVQGMDGNFYGSTMLGGASQGTGYGTVYKMASASTYAKLHGFAPPGQPMAPLVEGTNGKLYGVSENMIFSISESGEYQKLFDFNLNSEDGLYPNGPLVEGNDGNFYGTTYKGGANNAGTIFKITAAGQVTLLHNFGSGSDGAFPLGGLVQATDGNFYGTTSNVNDGCGTIFRISSSGSFATLYAFTVDGAKGCEPWVTLLQHTNGLLYGDTATGGAGQGAGVFFSIDVHLPQFVATAPAASRVGQTVGIFGQGFSGTTAVSFNGTPAQFTVVSDTYLTAPVPGGATTGFVKVTTPSGELTSNKKFQVRPQVTGFSPASGPAGTSVVITGVTLAGATRVTFGSTQAVSFTQNSDSQVTAVVPSGAVTGKIGVTTAGAPSYSHSAFTVTQ